MDVDKSSCDFVFEDFKESLKRCHFCAIDQEMTGVDCSGKSQSWATGLTDLYEDSREVVDRYIAFQFGIALFTLIEEGVYEVKPYNFYLRKTSGDFVMSSEAISFLASHSMDFQRWLLSGMPYCDRNEEKRLREEESKSLYSEVEVKIAQYILEKIVQWYHDSENKTEKMVLSDVLITPEVEALLFSHLSVQEVFVELEYSRQQRFYSSIDISVQRIPAKDFEHHIKNVKEVKLPDISKRLGFRRFWNCITDFKKPIIGHNFWLDLMFMLHMHEAPLPANYIEYKKELHQLFPCVYDTKTLSRAMATKNPFKSLHLEGLYRECCKHNEDAENSLVFRSPPGYHFYDPKCTGSGARAHEAGYDAYMTGVAFAIIKDIYRNKNGFELGKWENVISVYGSHYYMNITSEDFLKTKTTFLVEFENDLEKSFVRFLLSSNENVKVQKMDQGADGFDCHLTFDPSAEGKYRMVTVQFKDDTTNEESVQSRIHFSATRLNALLKNMIGEKGIALPEVKRVVRLV
ncbi:ribonuclease [Trypanosoma grayi]|uniref:ribonuclease n=1 Tax=Trypanosoma grayi TaxID=71804 RepID=UPI0004F4353A|nr:ribonuclease [Trypanosoma grayi]KEG12673.1 ribonuclease [Trypanosoma grayi]